MLKNRQFTRSHSSRRHGAVVPLIAILLPVLILLGAFAINVAYIELHRTEMYVAANAASRAACREMAITNSKLAAIAKGSEAGGKNKVCGKSITFADEDFTFGQSNRASLNSRYTFSPSATLINSVEVTANKSSTSKNGPIQLPIPFLFNTKSVNSRETARSSQVEVDISLVIDRSGSMAYSNTEKTNPPDFDPDQYPNNAPKNWKFGQKVPNPSRWIDAVSAVEVFMDELKASPSNELLSLTTYNSGVTSDSVLSNDYTSISKSLDKYTKKFDIGGTNIGGGILGGRNEILSVNSRQFAAKVMIVLTDGIDTAKSDPVAAAGLCLKDKIMIFAITFSNEADQATMLKVAQKTLGKHYHATSAADLQKVFKVIAGQLPILISQ